jgi:hypothetical protein
MAQKSLTPVIEECNKYDLTWIQEIFFARSHTELSMGDAHRTPYAPMVN